MIPHASAFGAADVPAKAGLQLASTSVASPPQAGAAAFAPQAHRQHDAWRGAMEQAQLAQWFPQGHDRPASAPALAVRPAPGPPLFVHAFAAAQEQAPAGGEMPEPTRPSSHATERSGDFRATRHGTIDSDSGPASSDPQTSAVHGSPGAAQSDAQPTSRCEPVPVGASLSGVARAPSHARTGEPSVTGLRAPPAAVARSFDIVVALSTLAAVSPTGPGAHPAVAQNHQAQSPTGLDPDVPTSGDRASTPLAAAARAGAPDASPRDAVRIHVDLAPEGARAWLGLDAAHLPLLPVLVRHLSQQLGAAGLRLATLTCNGRPVPRTSFPGDAS
ncbi:hypothetical protein [Ramlibacter sp.]|uniref:hypothetical protein n=1 Tax=Ramlibacter sp. TaxID=1917967 RepID=UPI003D10F0C9